MHVSANVIQVPLQQVVTDSTLALLAVAGIPLSPLAPPESGVRISVKQPVSRSRAATERPEVPLGEPSRHVVVEYLAN